MPSNTKAPRLKTAQIGKCGELLVQYHFLLRGIESSPMATDSGIDLVAYSPVQRTAHTVQVKTNLRAKPGGGAGKAALDWWVPEDCPAEFVTLVDLSSQGIWLFTLEELLEHAQQRPKGRAHIYMYTDPSARPRKTGRLAHQWAFEQFRLENRVHAAFGM